CEIASQFPKSRRDCKYTEAWEYRTENWELGTTLLPLACRLALPCELVQNPIRYCDQFRIDLAVGRDRIRKRHREDPVPAQRGHLSELSAVDHVNRPQTIACSQHAIERRRRSAPLNVPQNHGAGFKSRALFYLAREDAPNPS